jgi:PKD repeat protein
VQVTNSDNSIVTNNIKYIKDYAAAAGSNVNVNALYYMQQMNENFPVESYQQVNRAGTLTTTSSSLSLFSSFPSSGGNYKYRPSAQLKFFNPDGVSDFAPFSVIGQTTSYDTRYLAVANYTGYDIYGDLQTGNDAHNHVNGVVLDNISGQPAITIKNAAASETVFNDFDSDLQGPWTGGESGSSSFTPPSGSHNGNAVGLGVGQSFSYTLNKNAVAANYILSAWINTSAAGTITFTLTPSPGTPVTTTQAIPNTAGVWKYQEWKISVSGMTASFTLGFSSSINTGVDDIIFYPETAEVTTYSYDPVTHVRTSQTNSNGISVYYTDDYWGRPVYTMDQDHNIVQKKAYVVASEVQDWNPFISSPGNVYANTPVNFSWAGFDNCESAGATVNWNFGDGGTASTSMIGAPAHTYTSTGTYTVSATGVSPIFGTKVLTEAVTVQQQQITFSFTNTTNVANFNIDIGIYNGSTEVYDFSGYTLANTPATIAPGTYTIVVTVTGGSLYNGTTGTGYSGILLNGNCVYQCQDYTSNNRATFSNVNLSTCTTINLSVNRLTCQQLSQ